MNLLVTSHAVTRYIERAKPQLGRELARRELEALIQFAPAVNRPEFVRGSERADGWLELAPEVIGVIRGGSLATVLTPDLGAAQQRERERKNRRRRHRRAARLTRSSSSKANRGRPRIEEEAWPT